MKVLLFPLVALLILFFVSSLSSRYCLLCSISLICFYINSSRSGNNVKSSRNFEENFEMEKSIYQTGVCLIMLTVQERKTKWTHSNNGPHTASGGDIDRHIHYKISCNWVIIKVWKFYGYSWRYGKCLYLCAISHQGL